ncbi:TRAP-type C4-dicarboxylate transport system [Halalkalibacter wakoensis JCM 9140]|uniref:TRAP-type C4-dicarboxylate transport system n=1 Tax=Halalkalibacter wakoensis JCM 9140 TaxID=1236970 RepID=W4Q3L8_9BACI|nr:C4-dicarboxylate TRAP transporter substrate-binding protein [Halalkalibacter wakoensis]GAE25944.1 TRAP-type C4-dicarboxylate transport system [Halalkalibacter wakoensis JCM 9140]
MKNSRTWLVFFSIFLFTLILAACGSETNTTTSNSETNTNDEVTPAENGEKETITLRIGAGAPIESSIWLQPIRDYFMKEVNESLENYEIDWVENWGTITDMPGELETIEAGLLDVGFSTAAFQPTHLKMSSMGFNTPFSSSDPEIIAEVAIQMEETFEEFAGEYDKVNAKLLGLAVSENYVLTTTFPVNSLEDLQGKRIAGASANQKWLQASGAVPVQSALTEAYQSLQSGVYEGWVIFPSSLIGFKMYEQAKYITNVPFGSMILGGLVVNNDVWAGLPEEVQTVFEEVGKQYTYEIAKYSKESTIADFKEMEEAGVTITTLSPEDEAEWASRLEFMPIEYAEELNSSGLPGTEIMQSYIQFQKDAGHEFPSPYEIQ